MSYQPEFTITPALLARVEQIAALRERILAATVQVPWIPALQKDTVEIAQGQELELAFDRKQASAPRAKASVRAPGGDVRLPRRQAVASRDCAFEGWAPMLPSWSLTLSAGESAVGEVGLGAAAGELGILLSCCNRARAA